MLTLVSTRLRGSRPFWVTVRTQGAEFQMTPESNSLSGGVNKGTHRLLASALRLSFTQPQLQAEMNWDSVLQLVGDCKRLQHRNCGKIKVA